MKILIIHEVDYLEKVIYEIHEFPELLAQRGHEVSFFQFQEGARRAKKNLFTTKRIKGRVVSESEINIYGPHQFGVPGFDRLWATLSCIPALISLFRNNEFDVVLNYAVPTYGLQALVISRIFKVPFVHRALDASHEIRKSIYRIPILIAEKLLYRFSPVLSANNPSMARYCNSLSGRRLEPIVNYPPLDMSHFSKIQAEEILPTKLGINRDDKVIAYMGSFFYFSGLPQAIKRFAELTHDSDGIKLLLIGGGEQASELRKLVDELGVSNKVIFTGFVTYDVLPKYLRLASIAINTLQISQVSSVAFPHKVLQYLASDLPVVSTRLDGLVSTLDGLVGLNWADSPEEVVDLALQLLTEDPIPLDKAKVSSRLSALFSPPSALRSLEETLEYAITTSNRN